MKLETYTYPASHQTPIASHPLKDPARTLVIVFGPSHLLDHPGPIHAVLAAYAGAAAVGCSSSGDISPYATGHCDLHNQTMTLTTISEAA